MSIAPMSFPDHKCGAVAAATSACIEPYAGALRCMIPPHDDRFVHRADDAQAEVLVEEQLARELLHVVRGYGIDAALDLLGADLASEGELVAAEAGHPAGGRLEREREVALDVLLGERELGGVDWGVAGARELLENHVDAGLYVLGRGSGVDAEQPRAPIRSLEGVDAVDEAALLANLLKEPAGHAAAQDRIEERQRVAALVADVDAARSDDDMRLFAVFVSDVRAGRGCRPLGFGERARTLEGGELLGHELDESIVLDVARRGHDHGVRRVVGAHVRA